MKKIPILFVFLLTVFYLNAQKTQQRKPNIVLIMADDLGFSDVGTYGSEISTPNIDQLAKKGVRLKQFYNTGRCCPTRAALLTGLYPHNTGLGYMTGFDQGVPGYQGELSKNAVTIAEALKNAGYKSYMSGKWHVSTNTKPKGSQENWPRQRGFDEYFGTLMGSGSFFTPKSLTSGNTAIKAKEGFYLTDAIADSASVFIQRHMAQNANNPFFLYVAFTAPHWPLHAKKADIDKYIKLYEEGWDALREKRYRKQLHIGIIDNSYKLSERQDTVPAWKDIPQSEKALWVKRMAVYAAQVDCMDQGIGRIMETLKNNQLIENTVLIFMSDNGGCAEYLSSLDTSMEKLGTDESYESYRGNWANLSNTPFRLFKTRLHEGGIHTPFIFSWPGHTAKEGTIIQNDPAHVIDLMPTFLDIAGINHPTDGRSILPVLKGEMLPERILYWEHQANRAIRSGDWKLVSKSSEEAPYIDKWELYNLKTDKTERIDLADQFPDKVKKLELLWTKWAKLNNVFPLNGTDLPKRGTQFKRVF